MTGNVLNFPNPPESDHFLIGPFTYFRVVIEGRVIPRLTGSKDRDGNISLFLDGRFAHSFPPEHAYQAAWLIANALAIGAGYSHLGAENKEQPFAPIAMLMDTEK